MAKTLEEHYGYLTDRAKLEKYQAAINQSVQSEHVVLDLGCGTGVLGLMALRAGAKKVIFVDESTIIEVARQTINQAGFADKAIFLRQNSFELALPERVDVVICDHVGYFGFDYGILSLLEDARQRFLKTGGCVIPAHIELRIAPVESDSCRELVGQWRNGSVPDDYAWLATSSANTKHAQQLGGKDLLADAAKLTTLDLGAEARPYMTWNAEFCCTRDGVLDGIAGWFDCLLCDDIRMTNSPAAEQSLDRPQAILPLIDPVPVSADQRIKASVMVRQQDNIIGWRIELPDEGKIFSHSTFNGELLDETALTRARPDRVARLNDRGHARQVVLSYCDGKRTVADIQALVQRDHPDLFPSEQALSAFVIQVLTWDTDE